MALGWGTFSALVLACLFGWASVAVAADDGPNNLDRFELWTACAPLAPLIEDLEPNAGEFGLTWDVVRLAVESRLRAARIYRSEGQSPPYLSVAVGTIANAYSVQVQLHKGILDPLSVTRGLGMTWQSASYGTHADDATYILGVLSGHLDEFIAEYLRVNESACSP